MLSLVDRVAARHRMAAFIPDKFFKGYEVEWKKLMSESVETNVFERVPYLVHDRVIPLCQRFIKELIELAPSARQTLEGRLGTRVNLLEGLAGNYSSSRQAVTAPYPTATALDHVLLHIETKISLKLEKDLPTLGKALKQQVLVDGAKIKESASRALKRASPEDLDAITSDDGRGPRLERRYAFFKTHVDGSIPRLIKKMKVEIDWAKWFSWIREILATNYTDGPSSEFDLNGMKVVVDDATVTHQQQTMYVKYMDAAYNLLKKKRLGRAWYGTTFIKCNDCGGVNQNTGGGTGGHYHIHPDTVSVYVRPSKFVIELMVHELGHRYWFKSMSQGQRAKFEGLIRTHKGERPKDNIPRRIGKEVDEAESEINTTVKALTGALDDFLTAPVEAARISNLIGKLKVETTGTRYWRLPIRLPFATEETEKRYVEAAKARDALHNYLDAVRSKLDHPSWIIPDDAIRESRFVERRAHFVNEAGDLVTALKQKALAYLDLTFSRSEMVEDERQERRQQEWDADPREITPVSDYGKSNIDEAFAEAFAHYVLGLGMNADQEASFKAVLLDKDRMAAKVANRWLEAQ